MPGPYLPDWQKAKDTFEEQTGLKKPAAKGKLLFVSWRKPSGMEDALKAIDKHEASVTNKTTADAKYYKTWETYVADLKKKRDAYLKILEKAIEDEKDKAGKSDLYRAFKVLKSEVDVLATRTEQFYKDNLDVWQLAQAKGGQDLDKFEAVLHAMKMLGTNLKSGTAKATLFCKQLLADPSPTKYNSGINTAARDMSQSITNIQDKVYADWADLWMKGKKGQIDLLDNEKVAPQLQKMQIALYGLEKTIKEMGTESGNTPLNASLAKMGNNPVFFPDTATADDVKAAVKHFAEQIKKCAEVSTQLLKFA